MTDIADWRAKRIAERAAETAAREAEIEAARRPRPDGADSSLTEDQRNAAIRYAQHINADPEWADEAPKFIDTLIKDGATESEVAVIKQVIETGVVPNVSHLPKPKPCKSTAKPSARRANRAGAAKQNSTAVFDELCRDLLHFNKTATTLRDVEAFALKGFRGGVADVAMREFQDEAFRATKWSRRDVEKAFKSAKATCDNEKAEKRKKAADKAGRPLFWPPSGFVIEDGLLWQDGDEGKGLPPKSVMRAFVPLARGHDAAGGNECVVALAVKAGRETIVHIPLASMAGGANGELKTLSESGLTISAGQEEPAKWIMRALMELDLPRIEVTDKPGWSLYEDGRPSAFVCPDGTIIKRGGSVTAMGASRSADSIKATPIVHSRPLEHRQVAGTIEKQRDAFSACWESGLSHFRLAPMGSMLGTLHSFIENEDNPVMGIVGPSGGGKTSTERVIASGWGTPQNKKGPLRALRGTSNRQESTLKHANGTVACLDETKHYSGDLEDLVFMAHDGTGKDRSAANMEDRETMDWCTAVFITSEIPLEELVRERAKGRKLRVGMTVRCPDIMIVKKPLGRELMRRIRSVYEPKTGERNFGHLGPLFVKHLLDHEDPAAVAERVEEKVRDLADNSDLNQMRVAPIFAKLWEVGELLQKLGWLPTDADVAVFIKKFWTDYLAGETARMLRPEKEAADSLRETLFMRMHRHGQDVNRPDVNPTGELEFYFDASGAAVEFYVPTKQLTSYLETSASAKAVCVDLRDRGELLTPARKPDQFVFNYVPKLKQFVSNYRLRFAPPDVTEADEQNAADADRAAAAARAAKTKLGT